MASAAGGVTVTLLTPMDGMVIQMAALLHPTVQMTALLYGHLEYDPIDWALADVHLRYCRAVLCFMTCLAPQSLFPLPDSAEGFRDRFQCTYSRAFLPSSTMTAKRCDEEKNNKFK